MARDVNYSRPSYVRLLAGRRLTDKRISYYEQRGRYQRRAQWRETSAGRLVWSC